MATAIHKQNLIEIYSPFENHKNKINDQEIQNLFNNKYNKYLHQDFIFRKIYSNDTCQISKIIMKLSMYFIEYYDNLTNSNNLLKFLVKSKEILKKIYNEYYGYQIKFYEIFCKDIIKVLTSTKNLDFINKFFKEKSTLRNIIMKSLNKLFDNNFKIAKKLKLILIKKFINSNIELFNEDNQRACMINTSTALYPYIYTYNDMLLVKYLYFSRYLDYYPKINYQIIKKNFASLFQIKSEKSIQYIKNYFYKMIDSTFWKEKPTQLQFIDNNLLLIFGLCIDFIIKTNTDENDQIKENIIFRIKKNYLTNDFIKYMCLVLNKEIQNNNNNIEFYINTITNFYTMFIKSEKNTQFKNYLIDMYGKLLVSRSIVNTNFDIKLEEDFITKLTVLEINDNGKLNQIINDIRISTVCNNKIKQLNITSRDKNNKVISSEISKNDLELMNCTYLTSFTNYNFNVCKKTSSHEKFNKMVLIGKKFFENSIEKHKAIVEISDGGIIDFNAKINNKKIKIICNYKEFVILSQFNSEKKRILISKNADDTKVYIKLYLCGLLKKNEIKNEFEFQLETNLQFDYYDLFQLNYNINIPKKIETNEKTNDEKLLITQAHIVKFAKSHSDEELELIKTFNYIHKRASEFFNLDIDVFFNSLHSLIDRDYIKVIYYKRDDRYYINEEKADLVKMLKYYDIFPDILKNGIAKDKIGFLECSDEKLKDYVQTTCNINKRVTRAFIKYIP